MFRFDFAVIGWRMTKCRRKVYISWLDFVGKTDSKLRYHSISLGVFYSLAVTEYTKEPVLSKKLCMAKNISAWLHNRERKERKNSKKKSRRKVNRLKKSWNHRWGLLPPRLRNKKTKSIRQIRFQLSLLFYDFSSLRGMDAAAVCGCTCDKVSNKK